MSIIYVNDVCNFVSGKSFEEIKANSKNLYVKNSNDLYLLANKNEKYYYNNITY